MRLLFVSNGPTEDAIAARIAQGLNQETVALPLVGRGKAYERVAKEILGPRIEMPSGGFPFGSWRNLLADLRAGFIPMTIKQWYAARSFMGDGVIVVGDAYALSVGLWAAKGTPVFHVNPLVSAHYLENTTIWQIILDWGASDFTLYERLLHKYVRAVFVRDQKSQERLRNLGIPHAFWYGSFALDLLSAPERNISALVGETPVLAILPGTRGDERYSLPLMLEASLFTPLTPVVAWPKPWEALPPLPGWKIHHDKANCALIAQKEGKVAWLFQGAFSAILQQARIALATAGTASEQAAGLGIPVISFPTPGPQYTRAFARRQKRLLGEALRLTEANPLKIAAEVWLLIGSEEAYNKASTEGKERIGPPGGIHGTIKHIRKELGLEV